MRIGRRELLGSLAALPWLGSAVAAAAQAPDRIARAPIWLRRDRLWMPVSVGAAGPFDFIVDTGAFMNLMSERLVDQLDLRMEGSTAASGLGGHERFIVTRRTTCGSAGQVGAMRAIPGVRLNAAGLLSQYFTVTMPTSISTRRRWRLHRRATDRAGYVPCVAFPARRRRRRCAEDQSRSVDSHSGSNRHRSPGEILLLPGGRRTQRPVARDVPSPHRQRGIGGDGGATRRAGARGRSAAWTERPLVSLTSPARLAISTATACRPRPARADEPFERPRQAVWVAARAAARALRDERPVASNVAANW